MAYAVAERDVLLVLRKVTVVLTRVDPSQSKRDRLVACGVRHWQRRTRSLRDVSRRASSCCPYSSASSEDIRSEITAFDESGSLHCFVSDRERFLDAALTEFTSEVRLIGIAPGTQKGPALRPRYQRLEGHLSIAAAWVWQQLPNFWRQTTRLT